MNFVIQISAFLLFLLPQLTKGFEQSHRSYFHRTSFALNAVSANKNEWSDKDMFASLRDTKKMGVQFLDDLDDKMATMVTASAINTCSYYMLEFRDEINEKWMMGFKDFKTRGFPNGKWTEYLESMIDMDKQKVEVLMQTSKQVLRARKIPEKANVMMQYEHEIEPRKIAHRILTIREDVSNEMILDLGSIITGNDEIVRFSQEWVKSGREVAEKSRKPTRPQTDGGENGTPLRDANYHALDIMITQLALDLVREELLKARDESTIAVLDAHIQKTIGDGVSLGNRGHQLPIARTLMERMHNDKDGSHPFLEELYYKGITEGVSMKRPDGGIKAVNVLKLAENLLETRYAIAKEISKILSLQSLHSRHYYKLIKEKGGFDKFDMSKPKFKLVDMDKFNKQAQQAVSDDESMCEDTPSIPADLGLTPNNNNNDVFKRDLITASSAMDESMEPSTIPHRNSTNNDDDFDIHGLRYNDNFGQDGPMMM